MGTLMQTGAPRLQRGALMIEVLVTIIIVVIGLLGLLQMQSRLQKTEVESYQRTQAMMLVNDMATRISTNRHVALDYVTASPVGFNMDCDTIGTSTLQETDSTQWCLALQGAAEEQAGSSVGAMVGGLGCVAPADGTNKIFMVSVVWQGLTPISAPPGSVTCGATLYDNADAGCVDELCRRFVTTLVRVADLED
jgi:type IV pilus assembly protein PilV